MPRQVQTLSIKPEFSVSQQLWHEMLFVRSVHAAVASAFTSLVLVQATTPSAVTKRMDTTLAMSSPYSLCLAANGETAASSREYPDTRRDVECIKDMSLPQLALGHAAPCFARQHFLSFFPLPHGHGSFRPIFGVALTTWRFDCQYE